MRKAYIFLLIGHLFLQIDCKGKSDLKDVKQSEKQDTIKNRKMKKLDIKKVEKYKSNKDYKFIENDSIFQLEENEDTYREISKSRANVNFIYSSIYDKKTLNIRREGEIFGGMPIGVHKFYDGNGKKNKEINFDKDFKFSLNDLLEKVKSELEIDLKSNAKMFRISREISKTYKVPVYDIYIQMNPEGNINRHIKIHGINGEIILDEIERSQG